MKILIRKKIFICFFLLFACSSQERQFVKEMNSMQSKTIQLPTTELILCKSDESHENNQNEAKLKLIVYSDSLECTSCAINKINLWDSFIDYAEQFNNQLKFYFIFSPSKNDINSIKLAIVNSMFKHPILLDTLGEFKKLNPHIPKNRKFHTFLLDENNKVILVGNPLYNKEIEKLFYKKTQELLSK